jgi:hypothetical protein
LIRPRHVGWAVLAYVLLVRWIFAWSHPGVGWDGPGLVILGAVESVATVAALVGAGALIAGRLWGRRAVGIALGAFVVIGIISFLRLGAADAVFQLRAWAALGVVADAAAWWLVSRARLGEPGPEPAGGADRAPGSPRAIRLVFRILLLTGLTLPFGIGLAVRASLAARGRPVYPWEQIFAFPGILGWLFLWIYLALPYGALALLTRIWLRLPAPRRERRARWLAVTGGVVSLLAATAGAYPGMWESMDPLLLLALPPYIIAATAFGVGIGWLAGRFFFRPGGAVPAPPGPGG